MGIGEPQCFLLLSGDRDMSDLPGSRSEHCQPKSTRLGVGLSFHSSPRHLSLWAAGAGSCVSATRNPRNSAWNNLQTLRNRCHKAKPSRIYLQRTPVPYLAFWSPKKVIGPSSVQMFSSLNECRVEPIFSLLVFFHPLFIQTPNVSSFWSSLRIRKYKEISGSF